MGPGTELEKLIKGDITLGPFHVKISKLGYHPSPNCNCQTRIDIMNQWGPKGCRDNMETIVSWLRHSAAAHNIKLPRLFYVALVELAINNSL